jgi:peptidoglycan hydrolase CwlO-like protein
MALPLAAILKTLTTLGSAIGLYVAQKKEEKIEGKRNDTGKIISELQADLQKQTAFIESLTKQVEALVLQVQKQDEEQARLKVMTFIALGLSLVIAVAVIWMKIAG